ncbi:MAG: MetS family NSS transporter small subunit [Candidatus Thermoplasmatota archaeon]|nr:MetS family NSS transporter small subunit [Candidatus Thermoplasmatota archaeon]
MCRLVYVDEKERKKGGPHITDLSPSATAMLIFGAVVCYGGVAYFLYRALRKKHK